MNSNHADDYDRRPLSEEDIRNNESLEARLSLVQRMLSTAAAELSQVVSQLKDSPGGPL